MKTQVDDPLSQLRCLDADPARVEHIRARCRRALAAQRSASAPRLALQAAWRGWLEPVVVFGLVTAYLSAAVGTSLRLLEAARGAFVP